MRGLIVIVLLLLASCKMQDASSSFKYDESLPFGIWSAGDGRVVSVGRDNSYALCVQTQCEKGVIRRDGLFGVHLIGFWGMNGAKSLLKDASTVTGDLDFTESGAGPDIHARDCRGRPCVVLGPLDSLNYVFVKIEDWH